ncbi:hypothetical protein [Pseudoduganella sp.]|uniref:hypothetical protein n=1 Tax=Pseudoduganella sp. TaxID=1880898 RepID=UPI0035AE7823
MMKISAVLLNLICVAAIAQEAPLPEVERSSIEYKSPAEALTALRSKPGVEIDVRDGWTIAFDPESHVVWSFPPQKHASYPSVVKRKIVERDGTVFVEMGVKCGAGKSACDDLVREFVALNEAMRSSILSRQGK